MDFIKRDFQDKYFSIIDKNYIVSLLGPRRVGKSTFVNQYISSRHQDETIYFNFDEMSTREDIVTTGLEKLIEAQAKNKTKQKIIFIDEVQKVSEVFEQIKIIYDKQKHTKTRYRFILTGSSSLNIQNNISESLAGRVVILKIPSFSILEGLRVRNCDIDSGIGLYNLFDNHITFEKLLKKRSFFETPYIKNNNIKNIISEIVELGSLPEVLEKNDLEEKQRYIKSYKDTYLEKDIRGNLNIGDLKGYSNLLTILASQVGNLLNKNELAEKIGLTSITISKYISVLEHTYILNFLQPYIFSASKRLVKSPKEYLFDNGIISLLSGFITYRQLVLSGLIGARFENLVINELRKKLEPYLMFVDFYFWRSTSGFEIDLIIDLKETIIPCEIKWTDNPNQVKINALAQFIDENKKADFGFVIYNGEFYVNKEKRIFFVPFSNLAIC